MQTSKKIVLAAAATLAAIFIASCDGGSTSPSGVSFIADEGQAVEWVAIPAGTSEWKIAQANGIIPTPSTAGYYKIGEVGTPIAAAADGTLPVAGAAAGDIYGTVGAQPAAAAAIVEVSAAGKVGTGLTEGDLFVVKKLYSATDYVTAAANVAAVTGAVVGDVYKVTVVTSGVVSYQLVANAGEVPTTGADDKVVAEKVYALADYVTAAANVAAVTGAAVGDVYKVTVVTSGVVSYKLVEDAGEVPTTGATDKVAVEKVYALADYVTAAANVAAVTGAAVGDVYKVTVVTTGVESYQLVATAGEVPTTGATDKVVAVKLEAGTDYIKGADNKITAFSKGDLVYVTRIAGATDSTNTGLKIVKTGGELTAVTDAIYTVAKIADAGAYYNFN